MAHRNAFAAAFVRASRTAHIGSQVNPKKYQYGFLNKVFQKPVDLTPTLPCNFTRDANNVIQHDMDFSQYTGGTVLYVNLDTGNDTSGNGSSEKPYKTLGKAVIFASTGVDSSYCIKVKSDSIFMRDESLGSGTTITNKILSIVPDNASNKIFISSGQRSLSYIDAGSGTWQTTRSVTYAVYDMRVLDANGLPIPLTAKNTLADCQANINTWYTNGSLVYVHTVDGLIPNANVIVCITQQQMIKLLGTSKLYLKNCTYLGGSASDGASIIGDTTGATVVGEFCADNCNFIGGNMLFNTPGAVGNALAVGQIKKTYLFNCKAAYAKRDGFNYHFNNVPDINKRDCLVIEYNCESYNNGLISDMENNNATTCHDSVNILRFRGNYSTSKGPVVIDVNGCYSVLVDCNAKDSVMTGGGVAYNFGNGDAPAGITGKVIMYNCSNNGETLNSKQFYAEPPIPATLYASNLPNLVFGSSVPTIIP